MNGYFVRQDVLDILEQMAELQEMQRGLATKPEHMSLEEIADQIQACRDTIESLGYDLEQLAEWLAGNVRNNEMQAAAFKAEAEIWKTKQYKAELRAKSGKEFLHYLMDKVGQKKMNAGKFSLTIAQNGGKMPINYNIDDMHDLPAKFRIKTVTYKADDAAIREFLDAGGKSKYFEYGQRGTNLRIR